MTNALTIRAGAEEDLPQLLDLYRQLSGDETQVSKTTAVQVFNYFLAYKGSQIFIGQLESKIVTTCTVVIVPNLTRNGMPYGLIENVVTEQSHQKKGYGRAVLKTAVEHAWSNNCYKVMLLTGSNDPKTHKFYSGCGFKQDKTGFQIRRIPPRV